MEKIKLITIGRSISSYVRDLSQEEHEVAIHTTPISFYFEKEGKRVSLTINLHADKECVAFPPKVNGRLDFAKYEDNPSEALIALLVKEGSEGIFDLLEKWSHEDAVTESE